MTETGTVIRQIKPADIQAVTRIYNHYIEHSTSTFEEQLLTEKDMEERIRRITEGDSASYPWLVACQGEETIGFAYASPWKERSAYRFACETSIYLHPDHHTRGTGSALYTQLLDQLTELGICTAISIITLQNPGSIRLHKRLGFQKAGQLKRVGFKFDTWLDAGYWQKQLQKKL